jgi:hypothetical protein
MSAAFNEPILWPIFDLGTALILSTIRRQIAWSPLRASGSTGRRNNGASVVSLVNGHTTSESRPSKLSSCTMTTGRGFPAYSRARDSPYVASPHSLRPGGNRFGKGLILASVRARSDSKRLPARFGPECGRSNIRNPNLNRTKTLRPQALPVISHLYA